MSMPGYLARRMSGANLWRTGRSSGRVLPLPGEEDGRRSWAVARRSMMTSAHIGAALKGRRNSCSPTVPARVVPAGLKFCRSATAKAAELKCGLQAGESER